MEPEEWRVIPDFGTRYEVSSWGRIRSWAPWGGKIPSEPRYLTLRLHRDGYIKVGLSFSGKVKWHMMHRLVAMAWHGKPSSPDLEVRHIDGSRTNNRFDNLQWGTAKENAADRRLHGRDTIGSKNGMTKLLPEDVLFIQRSTDSCSKLSAQFGVSRGNIWNIRNGKSWSHLQNKGYGA